MKIFRNRKTAKTNFTGRKTTKMRFFILASIVLVAISSTVAFSSITTAGSLGELLSGKVSLGNMLFNASVQDGSKKRRQIEPSASTRARFFGQRIGSRAFRSYGDAA